jgi:hypothetical protein
MYASGGVIGRAEDEVLVNNDDMDPRLGADGGQVPSRLLEDAAGSVSGGLRTGETPGSCKPLSRGCGDEPGA